MYDTVEFLLTKDDAQVDSFNETVKYFDEPCEHNSKKHGYRISGKIKGFKIYTNGEILIIKGASLRKFFFEDDYKELSIDNTRCAIEELSKLLHLPMHKARITRLDFGFNLELENTPSAYLPKLGELNYFKRILTTITSLYYRSNGVEINIYDKNKERKSKHRQKYGLPNHLLRFELRFKSRISKKLGYKIITADMLYNADFYNNLKNTMWDYYSKIYKENESSSDLLYPKTFKDYKNTSYISYIRSFGGLNKFIENINMEVRNGVISSQEAYRIREFFRDIMESCTFAEAGGLIEELSEKVRKKLLSLDTD